MLPEMLAFDVDIIFVSAEFNGHRKDLIGKCQFVKDDFVWTTEEACLALRRDDEQRVAKLRSGDARGRLWRHSPSEASALLERTLNMARVFPWFLKECQWGFLVRASLSHDPWIESWPQVERGTFTDFAEPFVSQLGTHGASSGTRCVGRGFGDFGMLVRNMVRCVSFFSQCAAQTAGAGNYSHK